MPKLVQGWIATENNIEDFGGLETAVVDDGAAGGEPGTVIFFVQYNIECMYRRDGSRSYFFILRRSLTFSEVLCEQTSQDIT